MIRTSNAPVWIVIIRNVLLSAFMGILAAGFVMPLLLATIAFFQNRSSATFDVAELLRDMITTPVYLLFITPFLLPLIGPLIAMACAVALIFQKSIRKRLVMWCLISPAFVWLAVVAMSTWGSSNNFTAQFTRFENFLIGMANPGSLLYLIAASASALVFYLLSRNNFKW
ncbi:MAG: hypothetical protein KJ667_02345 [Alphaproteobacteria bacterium]|nr:hypothetical protein [Alphaproteobacteria bacterium]